MKVCKYCSKKVKPLGLSAHQRLCPHNPNSSKEKHPSYGRKGTNQYMTGSKMTDETKNKISKSKIGKKLSTEHKLNLSKAMQEAVRKHPDSYSSSNVSGRAKIIEHSGFKLKGTWELEFAKYLDSRSIKWTNIIKPFEYLWNEETHLYFPDFYLIDLDVYIEVKGYIRERDLCKWSVVPNLKIIKLEEIRKIKDNSFILQF